MKTPSDTPPGRILDAAQVRFFAHGFSRVSMDELAADLGMSKRTLYRHFRSKHELLAAVVRRFTDQIALEMDPILADRALDFPVRLGAILAVLGRRLVLLDKYFIEDLVRHAPREWERIEDFRRERILRVFGELFKEGAAEGHFRKDLDPALVLQIYFHSIQNILNPRTL